MITFYTTSLQKIIAVQSNRVFSQEDTEKLFWLFGDAQLADPADLSRYFIGPRAAMVTPWSTNAVEITQNMNIEGIERIEEFFFAEEKTPFDPMINQRFHGLDQNIFKVETEPKSILYIDDVEAFNQQEGLALNENEVEYLNNLSKQIDRKLTDSEVFGFSQVNSEHCRHKIFNGTFIIDGQEKQSSLFKLIKETSKAKPQGLVSAYKDNVAFIDGPKVEQFAPTRPDVPSYYENKVFDSVISLKAETHNFPTTVEPFNGAATGSGGEIRDRLAGGKGSIPLAGTAVYMTSYSRLNDNRKWEDKLPARKWLYQTPLDILIKASNGASDFGNKFGQPLICGSVLTFEHQEHERTMAYDKVIMMAGGIGYGKKEQALKDKPKAGDQIVILGGDNYRIGMGGAAVSSADTGNFSSGIELNAVQRSNPEMQKRTANTIRALVESVDNPIVSIHDHGAGGHLNCLSELVEETGGVIDLESLPVGDPTLSAKEIIGNESQERMGLVIAQDHYKLLEDVAKRERSPIYQVGKVTGDHRFSFASNKGENPMDLALTDMFGSSPHTVLKDKTLTRKYEGITYNQNQIQNYIKDVLKLESVACKDWLTNKVDRCVGGRVVEQQCVGPIQLPLNNCAVVALDFNGQDGIATSIGHAPIQSLIDPAAGSRMAIAESLTNIIWAPLKDGLSSVSLSANWMWPSRNEGEDERLYAAVEAVSQAAIQLGINIPTGKDSLSMAQKYPDETVLSPGTVIISATGHCSDIRSVINPVFQKRDDTNIYYLDMSDDDFQLGGSAFAQTQNKVGTRTPDVKNLKAFAKKFDFVQDAIKSGSIIAGHDISSGGILTCLLELCFTSPNMGAKIDLSSLEQKDLVKILFAENSGIIFQASAKIKGSLDAQDFKVHNIGKVTNTGKVAIHTQERDEEFDVHALRDQWFETSYLLDDNQTANGLAKTRFEEYHKQVLDYSFPSHFTGQGNLFDESQERPIAAIIREKGSNSEREMANSLYRAGFKVRDVHMTDLISGRETLEDVQFLGAVGGFSNSDVLGSAKGWAGAFKYNPKAKQALHNFFQRKDTMSIGICNGCQLFLELDLINPEHEKLSKMKHNDSMKHESHFTTIEIKDNNSIMMSSMAGAKLGVWISHGEGKFSMPMPESAYQIVGKYAYKEYPANPNGSDYETAILVSEDGRHMAAMPHIERSFFAWNWAYYPEDRVADEVSPWAEAFVNARNWCVENK